MRRNKDRLPRCTRERSKIIYTSPSDATNEAARLIADGSPMGVYRCPFANHYHVGTVHKMRPPGGMMNNEDEKETMTIAELIAELQKQPQDALVYTEGCDCIGGAMSVHLEHDGTVMISRSE